MRQSIYSFRHVPVFCDIPAYFHEDPNAVVEVKSMPDDLRFPASCRDQALTEGLEKILLTQPAPLPFSGGQECLENIFNEFL